MFDSTTADPARLTRAPILTEREFEYHGVLVRGMQKPIHTNWGAVYHYDWKPLYEQWKNRPLAPEEQFGSYEASIENWLYYMARSGLTASGMEEDRFASSQDIVYVEY